ncbi:Pathogenic type III effector avirulence factor Avr cleavage site-containing protein [Cynara cardunculus var. scolymus]|uniref:Pathogenic type III effector avirulence factor Avr cleavage site-containing protein n=1 Tax=Cynara cardunculus var. scolymus TaxID=59895 RepID=A0A103Y782_CYNCS|nr:Pathogenic type III effector avirulence factor Avr cleavage site-containing protein [Cynara cardunculus var. scolymus]
MDEFRGNHIPAFGSWDCNNHLPFTQCFESARQAGFIGYGYGYPQDRDLYVAGDLYENNVVTPAMIVVPRRRRKAPMREEKKDAWVMCDYDYVYGYGGKEEPPAVTEQTTTENVRVIKPKAVDEDLYKISPELLRRTPRRVKLFPSLLLTSCLTL